MTQIFDLIIWIFRRGPLGLGLLAAAVLGAGFYLQILQNEGHADDAAALAAGPPAAVDVAKFDRNSHMTSEREAVIRAQPVYDFAYELTLEKNSGDDEAFMIPLVSATSSDQTEVVGIAFIHDNSFDFDQLTPELMTRGVVGFGSVGPIIEYNGKISSLGSWDEITEEAFLEKGLRFRNDLVIVWPYINGREAAFAPPEPGDMTIFGLLSIIAGALGLVALAKLVFGSKQGDTPTPQPDPLMQRSVSAPAADTSGVPLWKQRAGLVDATDSAEPARPSGLTPLDSVKMRAAAPELPSLSAPKRSGFGLRKVLIGIVGGLFALGLVSVITDLIAESTSVSTVAVVSAQDRTAATIADAIVPDADPDRHWTDIDVTPVVEWFVAKFFLALSGDTDAQIMLGSIVGGLFIALFMLRVYITARLSSTLNRRRSYNFDDLTTGG